jgi:hypothetical protein
MASCRGDPQRGQYSIRARERFSEKRAVREGRDNRDSTAAPYVRDALRPRADYGGEPDSFDSAHVEDTLPQTAGSADHGNVARKRGNRVVSFHRHWNLLFVLILAAFTRANNWSVASGPPIGIV